MTPINLASLILLSLISTFIYPIQAASPPDHISITYPVASDNIPFNSTFEVFAIAPDDPSCSGVHGLISFYNITVTHPNGTTLLGVVIGDLLDCRGLACNGGGGGSTVRADASGEYTIHWNITYGLSSDPLQANSSYCGPEPFSWQTFILNKTVTVLSPDALGQNAGGVKLPLTTVVSQFPSEPTGQVPSGSSKVADQFWEGRGWGVILGVAAMMILVDILL